MFVLKSTYQDLRKRYAKLKRINRDLESSKTVLEARLVDLEKRYDEILIHSNRLAEAALNVEPEQEEKDEPLGMRPMISDVRSRANSWARSRANEGKPA